MKLYWGPHSCAIGIQVLLDFPANLAPLRAAREALDLIGGFLTGT
jgi:hypothetical protein